MKTLKITFSLILTGSFLFTGCTYKNATINYKNYNAYSGGEAGNIKYKEIAPISATSNGFLWDDCTKLTENTLRELNSKAKALGGNGVIRVKWATDNGWSLTPTCETQWGWSALYILPVFGPWVQHSHAEAVAIKITGESKDINKKDLENLKSNITINNIQNNSNHK